MYESNNPKYRSFKPVGYSASYPSGYSNAGYGSDVNNNYKSLISESKCRCRGTCRTGIGCTCKK